MLRDRVKFGFFVFSVLFFLVVNLCSVNSVVEVFSNYNTTLRVDSHNFIEINKTLTLKNVNDVGIVPGQIEFKIAKGLEGSLNDLRISNVSASDQFGNKIDVSVKSLNNFSVIVLNVYYPLLPNFEYTFYLNYRIEYKPGGIFFKSLKVPLRESTIPIEKGSFKVILPNSYHFTYFGAKKDLEINENVAVWKIDNDLPKSVVFEYSYIPLRFGSFKGSYVFWISINLILLLILYFEIRREIRKIKEKYGENV